MSVVVHVSFTEPDGQLVRGSLLPARRLRSVSTQPAANSAGQTSNGLGDGIRSFLAVSARK